MTKQELITQLKELGFNNEGFLTDNSGNSALLLLENNMKCACRQPCIRLHVYDSHVYWWGYSNDFFAGNSISFRDYLKYEEVLNLVKKYAFIKRRL